MLRFLFVAAFLAVVSAGLLQFSLSYDAPEHDNGSTMAGSRDGQCPAFFYQQRNNLAMNKMDTDEFTYTYRNVSVTSSYATLLGLALCCVMQPWGSLLFSDGGGVFWRLSPIAGVFEAFVILWYLVCGSMKGYSLRQLYLAMVLASNRSCNNIDPSEVDNFVRRSGQHKSLHLFSALPVCLLAMRVAATRGSPATVAIGAAYVASFLVVYIVVMGSHYLWDSYDIGAAVSSAELARRLNSNGVTLGTITTLQFIGRYFLCFLWYLGLVLVVITPVCFCSGITLCVLGAFSHRVFYVPDLLAMLITSWALTGMGVVIAVSGIWDPMCRLPRGLKDTVVWLTTWSVCGLLCLATFIGGSIAFIHSYSSEGTYWLHWMEWLGW
jgi:hypothetical protein